MQQIKMVLTAALFMLVMTFQASAVSIPVNQFPATFSAINDDSVAIISVSNAVDNGPNLLEFQFDVTTPLTLDANFVFLVSPTGTPTAFESATAFFGAQGLTGPAGSISGPVALTDSTGLRVNDNLLSGVLGQGSFSLYIAYEDIILPIEFLSVEVAVDSVEPIPSAVPVPAALPLFGTGLALMGFIGWRRRKIGKSL